MLSEISSEKKGLSVELPAGNLLVPSLIDNPGSPGRRNTWIGRLNSGIDFYGLTKHGLIEVDI
jgi:hypothetical protein